MGIIMINVLERIVELREERHWTEYQLAENQVWHNLLFPRGTEKYASYYSFPNQNMWCFWDFHIAVFLEDNNQAVLLNERELALLKAASKLNSPQYDSLLHFLEMIWTHKKRQWNYLHCRFYCSQRESNPQLVLRSSSHYRKSMFFLVNISQATTWFYWLSCKSMSK